MRPGKGGLVDIAINKTTHPGAHWLLQVLCSTRPILGLPPSLGFPDTYQAPPLRPFPPDTAPLAEFQYPMNSQDYQYI